MEKEKEEDNSIVVSETLFHDSEYYLFSYCESQSRLAFWSSSNDCPKMTIRSALE